MKPVPSSKGQHGTLLKNKYSTSVFSGTVLSAAKRNRRSLQPTPRLPVSIHSKGFEDAQQGIKAGSLVEHEDELGERTE